MKHSTESGAGTHVFNSRQATGNKPVLQITYTTEPVAGPVLHTSGQKTASGTGNSLSVAKPDNVSEGDLIVLIFSHQRSPATATSSFSTPSGFTLIRSEHDASASNRVEVAAFYKIATSNEPSTYTSTVTTFTNTPQWKAYAVRVTGFNPFAPIATHTGVNSGANSVNSGDISGINTTDDNSLIIAAASVRLNVSAESTPLSMILAYSQNGSGTADGSDNAPSLRVAYQHLPDAGSTGNKVYTWVGAARAAGLMFGINPANPAYCDGTKLINPGFESGLTRWNTWGSPGTSTDAFTGSYAAQIAGGNSGLTQEFIGIPGKTYNATVWVKASNIQWGQAYIEFFNASWQLISSTAYIPIANSSTYVPIQMSGVAPAGTYYVQFVVGGAVNAGGYIRMDDICLEEAGNSEYPGGVAGAVMWLKANKGLSTGSTMTWQDQSGFGRSAVQSNTTAAPALISNGFNFNPALTFDGSNDCIPVQNLSGLPSGASQVQMFAVANHTNTTRGWNHIFSYGSGNNNQIFGIGKHSGTANATTMLWGFDAISSTNEFSGNKVVLLDGKYTGTQGIISTYGTQKATITASSSRTTNAGYIGVDPVLNSGTYWQGNISEILVYPGNLNASQINRVNSYLSLKYGITLDQTTAQNYTASDGTTVYWNGTANSSHKNNIAGIVRDDVSGLNQKQSRSTNSGLQIVVGNDNQIATTNALNTSSFADDKSALVWGDNNGSVSTWTTTGAPTGFSITARTWKIQEIGTIGTVKIQVASSNGSNGLPFTSGGVFLIIDNDGNFTSGANVIAMTLNGVNWETSADLQNGQFFTFGTCSTIGIPSFAAGNNSTRCRGAGTVTYTATSTNSTGITYSLDAASLAAGNTINGATGAVNFVESWQGTSTITATATGCGGPISSDHVVTITPYVSVPGFNDGFTSTRCQGAGQVTYTATALNSTGISYSLDPASIAGGNTIQSSTGTVTYTANWTGTSVITATAQGCNGPVTTTHTVTINPTVGLPVFSSGSTSVRCQGAEAVSYTATASNATGISYSLDAASLAAGNSINATTGEVTYISTWSGTTVITATATGCNGPRTTNHTATITPSVTTPIFSAGTLVNRCGQAETVIYTATASFTTQITYTLDGASLAGGNTINASTGQVTWNATWVGTSTITATALGCNGPTTAFLTVESAGVFAMDDNATGTQGKPLYINLTTNDFCNYNINSVTIVSPPQSGNVQMGQNGQVVYLPAGNFSGNDEFVYQICQTANPGICDQATVYVFIEETFIDPCAEATRNKIYYLPFDENSTLRNALLSAGSTNFHSNIVRSLVSIKIPYPGIKLTYDHWEDGLENNIQMPVQSTTLVWGDGNLLNGVAPGYANDILPPGAYIVLDNQFQYNPRVNTTIAYDGRDKIFSTGDVSISKVTGDAGSGGGSILFDVQNLKTNVYDVSRYGEYFVVPFGENVSLGSTVAFRYTGISIKAAQNGTTFTFDYDGNGIVDFTQTLNEGEFWYYTGTASQPGSYPADVNNNNDIKAGAVVTSDKPVGVDLIFGDGFNFGTRNMALLPSIFNANLYYSPVYTTTPGNADLSLNAPVYVFFTNVLETPITIQWTSKTASGSVNIPANGTNYFEIPYTAAGTGYKFESTGGEPFSAISIVDADANGSRYDWAFNLIPEERLTDFTSIAWAPGSRDGAGNYNPIWVTPAGNTTLYIKLDGDLTGITSTMSPCGIPYDLAVPIDLLNSYQIFDNTDNDQSGAALYTCDGTKFVAVWGQNSNAGGVATPPGSPAQDVGYVLEPKCLEALIFANDDARFTEPNTPIIIDVTNNDFAFLSTLNPSSVSMLGLLQPANGIAVPNTNGTITYTPNAGFIGTDYFEYRICAIEYPALCDVAMVAVRITDCPTLESQNLISGKVFIEQLPDDAAFNNEAPAWGVRVDLHLDANCNGVIDAAENAIQSTTSDPSGNYSFSVTNGFNAADNFEPSPSFTNNSGGVSWSSAWIEQNDDLNFNSGNVRIMADASASGSGNAIRLSGNGTSTLRGISRSLTFSGATAATLRFRFRRQGLNNQGEQLQVLINGTQVLAYDDGDFVGTDANYTEVTYNLPSFNANGSNVVLFRVNSISNSDDFFWIDNVELIYFRNPVCYITRVNTTGAGSSYTASSLNQQTATFTGLNSCIKDKNLGVLAILTATDDIAYTATDVPVSINILQNDVIGKPNPLSVTRTGLSNQPSNGTVTINSDGTVIYTPNPGFNGTDDFEYRVCSIDDTSVCDIALVTVQVSCTYIPNKNSIIGKIYNDNDLDGNLDAGENGMSGIILNLVLDLNGNGQTDPGDVLVQSTSTNASGDYQFIIDPPTTTASYADNFNTNGSGVGSNGTTGWGTSPWSEVNESNGFGTPSIQVTGNQLRIQGDDLFYLDQFNANSTANQSNGTTSWTGQSWVEIGETNGFSTTQVTITSATGLRVAGSGTTTVLGARRTAPLSGAGIAHLSFSARVSGLDDQFDFVDVQVATSSSGPWTNLVRIEGPANDATYLYNIPIPAEFYSSTTTIRFVSSGIGTMTTSDAIFFDDIKIAYRPAAMFKGAARSANIATAVQANVNLTFSETGLDFDVNDYVDLEVSSSSLGPWTLLRRFTGADGNQNGNLTFDISQFISANTTIRFRTSPSVNFTANNAVLFDNITVQYQVPVPAQYIVQLAQPLPQDITLTTPLPSSLHAVSFTGAGQGSCNKQFGIARADLGVTKTASSQSVNSGSSLTYTITVVNNGPSISTNTVVNEILPSGFTITNVTANQGNWNAPNWNIGTLEPGQTRVLQLTGTVGTAQCNNITNQVSVIGSIADHVASNNSASIQTTVTDNLPPSIIACAESRTIEGCSLEALDYPVFSDTLTQTTFDVFSNAPNEGNVTDNCGNQSVFYQDVLSGTCPLNIQRTWYFTDINNNTSSCVQSINIEDNTSPVMVNMPTDLVLEACSVADIPPPVNNFADFETLGGEIYDNCTPLPQLTFTSTDNISGSCPIHVSRTYQIKDACDNTTEVVHHIYINDTTTPQIYAPDTVIQLGCNPVSLPDITMAESFFSVTDNCPALTINTTESSVTGACTLSKEFYITVTDVCGNMAVDTITFSWKSDTLAPVIFIPASGLDLGTNPATLPTKATVSQYITLTDICGISNSTIQDSTMTGTCEKELSFAVSAIDGCGNFVTDTITYHWIDTTFIPVISDISSICFGSPTTLSPTTGGTWTSSQTNVATITNGGVVTTIAPGTTTFTFTRTSDGCSNSLVSTMYNKPTLTVNQPQVCLDSLFQLTATPSGGTGPYSYAWSGPAGFTQSGQNVVRNPATLNMSGVYQVTVTDINGCTNTQQTQISVTDCHGEICFIGTNNNTVNASTDYYIIYDENPANNKVRIRTTFSKNFVDNTYGTNAIGWDDGHTFSQLVGSDHLIIALFDKTNVKKMELKLDYITASATAPSGYKCLGVTGGDGSMILGNVGDVLNVTTSLDKNFNQYGYVLTTNSPETNSDYIVNPSYPNWIYDVWYEVEVKLSAFGPSGFGSANITGIHASPSKTGNNTEYVSPGDCCILFSPTVSGANFKCNDNAESVQLSITDGVLFNWSNGQTTQSILVNPTTNTTYTVTVTDANNCVKILSHTITVANCQGDICFTGNNDVSAETKWSIEYASDPAQNKVKIRTTFSKNFVDNTYGTNSIGWPGGHTFSELVGSDHLLISLFDGANAKKMELKLDYITASTAAPSGYKCLGVTGGEGDVILGNVDDVLNVVTSLDKNFNEYGYVLTSNSPATDVDYTPNPTYPNWIYEVWYEVEVKLSAFGAAGFGSVGIAGIHASPSKTGNNTEYVTPGSCCEFEPFIVGDDVICQGEQISLTTEVIGNSSLQVKSTHDNFLDENNPGRNYGNCKEFFIGTKSGKKRRGIVKFDVSDIPVGASIISANLVLTKTGGTNASTPVSIHRVLSNWQENAGGCAGNTLAPNWNQNQAGINWNTPGGHFDNTSAASTNVASNGNYTWNIVSLVEQWVNTPAANHGLLIKTVNESINDEFKWASSEEGDNTKRPTLNIVYQLPESIIQYTWNTGATTKTIEISPATTTTYSVTLTATGVCDGAITSQVVTVNPNPALAVTGPSSICFGNSATLTAVSATATSYQWNTGAGTSSIQVTPTTTTQYTVTVTDTNGCTSTRLHTVVVNPNPTAILVDSTIQPTCSVPSGTLFLEGLPSSGTWMITRNPGNVIYSSTGTSYVLSGLYPGTTYSFVLTDVNQCQSPILQNVVINAIPSLPVVSGPSSVCQGLTAQLTPSTGGTWSSSQTAVATIQNSGLLTAVSPGTTTLTYTRTTDGCSQTWPFTIHANPTAPLVGTITQPNCITTTGSVVLNGLPSTGTWTLTRNPGNITSTGSGTTVTISALPPNQTFTFTIANAQNCVSGNSSSVVINPIPTNPVAGGATTVCVGTTANVTPATGGTWTSSSTAIATVTNAGVVSGLSAGSATLTYTRTIDGCSTTVPVSVLANPTAPVIGAVLQPTCQVATGSITLTGLPSTGSWTITRMPGLVTFTGSGTSFTVTNLTPNQTYSFTVRRQDGCVSASSASVFIETIPSTPVLSGPDFACVGSTVNMSPTSQGTWTSSNPSVANITNGGVVTALSPGMVILTYTRNSNNCLNTKEFTVSDIPAAPIVGTIIHPNCALSTGSVTLNGLPSTGTWTITRSPGNVSYTGSGNSYTVTGLAANTTYTFTVRNMYNCTSPSSTNVVITGVPSAPYVTVNYMGAPCLTENKQISASVTGGTGPLTYNWAGPSGFTSSSETIQINTYGNYYITVTDANMCSATSSGFVYESYTPFIVSLNTQVCEGQSLNLTASSPTAVSYLWSTNANSATTSTVSVTPTFPSSTYQVTVTNNVGCTAVPALTIRVIQKPVVSVTGPNDICVGQTTSLSPTSGGTWSSNNPGVATVNNAGVVTGTGPGVATFIFTNATTLCASDITAPIIVHPKPLVEISGPSSICIGATTQLTPAGGGTWISTNPAVASVTDDGVVTGLSTGTVQFYYTDSTYQCTSDYTASVSVDFINDAVINGPDQVCTGGNIVLIATIPGGTWTSSNTNMAVVNNSGILTGLTAGTVTITYQYTSGACAGQVEKTITIQDKPVITLVGPNEICAGETTTLTPSTGGIWTSSNTSLATISNTGVVTGHQAGYVTFTFQENATGCVSLPSANITIHARPEINLTGLSTLCIGQTTSFLPSSGGTWTSTNPAVATINNNGIVTALSAGTTTFIFTDNLMGCVSVESPVISVGTLPAATIDFHGNVCLTDTSKISVIPAGGTPGYTYSWIGPLGFHSTAPTVSITNNGMYYVTVTDAFGCKANVSGFVYQRFDPFVVNLSSTVCQGQAVQLSVNASAVTSYQWSANAGNAVTAAVTVFPVPPSSTYFVTVTNNLGCKAVANAVIQVNPKPVAQVSGPSSVCVGQTTQMSPSTGGTWTSVNPAVASITNSGLVTGISQGSARFIFTQNSTGCASDTTSAVNINTTVPVSFAGPSSICLGSTTQLSPSSGGTWLSSNPGVATVNNTGLVTAVSAGIAQFTFTATNGCTSTGMLSVTVHDKPAIVLDGQSQICLGSTTQFLPSAGGTWTSTNPAVAGITNAGLVTGLTPGTARFIFTNSFTGCTSDSSGMITIVSGSAVSITGPQTICVGSTTTLSPGTGGTWSSQNPSVANVTNAGLVTALSQGTATFTFTSFATGCPSMPTSPITVNPRPTAQITGPTAICIGNTSSLTPNTGGTWTSANTSVATVTNGGIITGVSAGMTNFVFTNTSTGCVSLPSAFITVNARPNVSVNSAQICVGGTTTLLPASGGTWTATNPSVVTISNAGVVTGINPGNTQFVFTESSTGCVSNPTTTLTILPKPTVSVTGPTEICQGFTTQVSPGTGGTWASQNATIAAITNSGLITGISNGTVRFTFTSNQGCISDPTAQITVNGKPVISISGPSSLCIGSSTQMSPSSGGTWTSSRPGVATISNTGLVTAVSLGTTRFVFTNSATGCKSDSSAVVAVNNGPSLSLIGSPNICIGQSTQLSPTVGGTWTSLTPSVATVSNSGLVTGIGVGQASFRYTQSSTGCESVISNAVTVLARPVTTLSGPSPICAGGNTSFTPNSGGTWVSLQPAIANINNSGIVTGVSQGSATFVFTSSTTGCSSLPSTPVSVIAKPSAILDGPSQICTGSQTQYLPASGGTWTSNAPAIASVDTSGKVTGLSPGSATFTFTETATGCVSNPTVPVNVTAPAAITVTGPAQICLGYTTTLSASSAGAWYSTAPDIAKTSTSGLVTGLAPGKVSFYFAEATTGCISYLPDDIITVVQCIDPDFNVTMVNVPVAGNVTTNDEVPSGTTYLNTVYLISKPDESTATLTMNTNGQYTFQADRAGQYTYHVMICLPGMNSNCPVSSLVINVVNANSENQHIISNLDLIYMYQDQSVTIHTTANDKCFGALDCEINTGLVSITQHAANGQAIRLNNGNLVYTPNTGFVGMDTLEYQVCAGDITSNCVVAKQIITVMATNALNSLSAADDFFALSKGGQLTGVSIITNDFDPEGHAFTITTAGNAGTPVSIPAGSYYITADGLLHFTPGTEFTGPVDIVYTICDSQGFCINATAHILVADNLKLRIRGYLEGPLMENKGAKSADNRPLMRDDLRFNPFTGTNFIPTKDPYSNPMDLFDISYRFGHVGLGGTGRYTEITNPSAVFAVTGQNAIVDWVYVELRSKEDHGVVLATRSALIQRDGDVVDLDGLSPVEFPGIRVDSCHVVLRHRNHFGVMSLVVSTSDLVDFTLPQTPVFDYGNTKNDGYDYTGLARKTDVVQDYVALWAGDFDSNGKIKFVNPDDDQNYLFFEVLSYPGNVEFMANYNFVYGYLQGDFDLNGKSKYDNPDDDKNMLFYQVLFHPLNVNFISNFNFITEQVPPRKIN